jgi:hypothetical protein
MAVPSALILYRPSPPSNALTLPSASRSLALTSRLFTQTTGTAIATELLYRLIWDILNRLATHVHKFAIDRLDRLGSFLEQRALARQESTRATESAKAELEIVSRVGDLAQQSGFVACPMGGAEGRARGPPGWVVSVLQGAEEGRIESREFWINGLVG